LLQTGVTIAVAVLVFAAGLLSSQAAGEWQSMTRLEVKRSAGLLQDTAKLYGDEAVAALDIAVLEARARASSGEEAPIERGAVDAVRDAASKTEGLAAGDRYRAADGSFEAGKRLADLRQAGVVADPDAALVAGDEKRRQAVIIALLVVPLLMAYLLAEFVLRRRQRRQVPTTTSADDVELVPRPWSSPSTRRFGVTVALAAWLTVSLLAVAQVSFGNAEQRSQALSSRTAVASSTRLAAGSIREFFGLANARRAVAARSAALGRQLAALQHDNLDAAARLARETHTLEATAGLEIETALRLSRPPTARDGVDSFTVTSLGSSLDDVRLLVADQNRDIARAEDAGRRGSRVLLAILLAGLALSLSALAASARTAGVNLMDAAAASLLAAALLSTASLVLI
jgi:hypothetical protein